MAVDWKPFEEMDICKKEVSRVATSGENITQHEGAIHYLDRCALLKQKGMVLWFTGLSGSGKSTIAAAVEQALFNRGKLVYRLDGDNLRFGLNSNLGFSMEDRLENNRRVAEVAALFKDAGVITLVSFISPFAAMRAYARSLIADGRFIEVYVKADIDTCIHRDPKGLYKKALAGEISDFTGISSPFEEPQNPDIILDTAKWTLEECVDKVIGYWRLKDKN